MEFNVVIHTEYEELKKEAERLADELARLVEIYSNMDSHAYNSILAEYMTKLGNLKVQEYNLYVKCETIKRKIQMIRACQAKQEEVKLDEINKIIREQLSEYYNKLHDMKRDAEKAKIINETPTLSEADSKELRSLYKQLVKKYHPDVKPDQTEKEKQIWAQIQEAYETGNIDMLRVLNDISEISDMTDINKEVENAMEIVNGKCERLREKIKEYEKKIEKREKMFPFNTVDLLADEVWLEEQREELTESIAEWREYYKRLKAELDEIECTL